MPSSTEHLASRNLLAVCRLRRDGSLIDANQACAALLGFASRESLLAHGRLDYANASDERMILAALEDVDALNALEVALRRPDGSTIWVYQNAASGEENGESIIDLLLLDLSEQRGATERFEFLTNHDPLTHLPNRSLLQDRLQAAIARAERNRQSIAVLFVDIDHFELINTTFGKGIADRVLARVAQRISETLRADDSVARFGSDEFAVILQDFGDPENTAMCAQRILDVVSKPITIEGHDIRVNASVGIAITPVDGIDSDILLQNASSAMYRAKELGRNTYQLHQRALNERAFERSFLVANLRRAIERNEFVLHFQPQVNVASGRIECVETLLRWNHPDLGVIEPFDFFNAAENSGLTVGIGDWVVREAARQLHEWTTAGLAAPRVSINLSRRQLESTTVAEQLNDALHENHADPKQIEFEISERLLGDAEAAKVSLASLRSLGASLAIEDYGTGSFSFADLKHVHFNTLKIDQSFVQNVTTHVEDAAIVDAIIMMARGLDMRVVAEGVENMAQMAHLRARRCNDMQGYFFGRPVPPTEMSELLKMQH